MIQKHSILSGDALRLLEQLISIPSLSKQEDKTADAIEAFIQTKGLQPTRLKNNIWLCNQYFDAAKPSILLNSHHDTVAANAAYTNDPHKPFIKEERLYGLGSTDAGASLVCLLATFLFYCHHTDLPYNLVFAASAEEEISGPNGIELLFKQNNFAGLFKTEGSFAIVGEPTELQLAIAEKGLLVLDCTAIGKAGHAAREEGENAIYKAMKAIEWFRTFRFDKVSETLGAVKMTVTSVHTDNTTHNIVPASCNFVVDIRVTDQYTHEEIMEIISKHVDVEISARSTRLRSSSINIKHPVVQAGTWLGKSTYGSATSSDQALIPLPSLKCGPGFSGQSHSADEYIEIRWIPQAVDFYIAWLEKLFLSTNRQQSSIVNHPLK